ncbi:Transcription initiation factor TFIID subunit 13 [Orbilia ellipsospora]|uniref:Transcription initiation factor TFIID subunit 13 n=1 Tax=Orbilia ellipsospora TaxID=2528407 RepID=A0AAV9X2Z4_9PEZI
METRTAGEGTRRGPRPQRRQPFFSKDLKVIMYAFGDDVQPFAESVNTLDEIVTEYIIEMCHEAAKSASHARRNKIKVDDFKFALRRDSRKLGRVEELLAMTKVIQDARKQFDETGSTLNPR